MPVKVVLNERRDLISFMRICAVILLGRPCRAILLCQVRVAPIRGACACVGFDLHEHLSACLRVAMGLCIQLRRQLHDCAFG